MSHSIQPLKPLLLSDEFEHNLQSVLDRLNTNNQTSCVIENIVTQPIIKPESSVLEKIKDNIGILFFVVVILFVLYNMKRKKKPSVQNNYNNVSEDTKPVHDYVYIPKSISF